MQPLLRNSPNANRSTVSGGSRKKRSHAFTVIELVVVVLVIAILAAVATPAFLDSLLLHRIESAARRVKADLELARQTARLTSASQSVTFSNSGYTLTSAVESFDVPDAQYAVNLTDPPFELTSVTANFGGTQLVTFDGYGKPASGGTVVLTTKNHQCTVTLDAGSGRSAVTSAHARARTP